MIHTLHSYMSHGNMNTSLDFIVLFIIANMKLILREQDPRRIFNIAAMLFVFPTWKRKAFDCLRCFKCKNHMLTTKDVVAAAI